MTKGETSTGFKFNFNEKVMKDARFIEHLASITDEDLSAVPYVLNTLLGEKQKEKLYDHVAKSDPDGLADITVVMQEIGEMIKSAGEDEKK